MKGVMIIALVFSFLSAVAATQPKHVLKHHKINLNTANEQALVRVIKGLGKKRIQAIVAYRKTHGQFKSIRDLAKVKGIGKSFVQRRYAELDRVFTVER